MPDYDDQFIDVPFDRQPEYTFGDKGAPCWSTLTDYESSVPVLTTKQINEAIERMEDEGTGAEWLVSRIYDQKNEGSCVANACAQANEVTQAKQFGLDNVIHLSAMSLYKRIGRSASSGAVVSDGLEEMQSRGILPLDNPENRTRFGSAVMENTGFRNPFPADWEQTAMLLILAEYHTVKTPEGLMTALCNRDPCIIGREGHSICYVKPLIVSGRWGVGYANSWSKNWGLGMGSHSGGFGIDTLSQLKKSAKYAFVVRSVKNPNLGAAWDG